MFDHPFGSAVAEVDKAADNQCVQHPLQAFVANHLPGCAVEYHQVINPILIAAVVVPSGFYIQCRYSKLVGAFRYRC